MGRQLMLTVVIVMSFISLMALRSPTPSPPPATPTTQERKCSCPSIIVKCVSPIEQGMPDVPAWSEPASCILALRNCIGITPGVHDPADFNECLVSDMGGSNTFVHVKLCCAIAHEIKHLEEQCQNSKGCDESNADAGTSACYALAAQMYCSRGTVDRVLCYQLCNAAVQAALVERWDNCICSKTADGSDLDKGGCCSCYGSCKNPQAVFDMLPPACKSLAKNSSSIALGTQQFCEGQLDGNTNDHTCAYYNNSLGAVDCSMATPSSSPTSSLY